MKLTPGLFLRAFLLTLAKFNHFVYLGLFWGCRIAPFLAIAVNFFQIVLYRICCVFRPANTCASCAWEAHIAFHEPLMCMMKKVLFHNFQIFFIVFDHANDCASLGSLVQIHNKDYSQYRHTKRLSPIGGHPSC